ncbi:MAG: 3-hydroxyacyl-CoA dehydrogenase NAD-binding domain-containing protein [Hyphomicrobiaceae bacterium]
MQDKTQTGTAANVTTTIDGDGVAVLTWDMPGRSMNVLSEASIRDFAAAVQSAVADDAVRGIVITSGKKDFIAGADLTMLAAWAREVADLPASDKARRIYERIMTLQRLLRQVETCGKPVAAALPGTALGGGLEVALAAHHRVVADNDKVQLGLPEVQLGLMPGAGGTQRVARLVGVMAAAPIIMEGKPMSPRDALKAGIVHAVVPTAEVLPTAKAWVLANVAEAERVRAARAGGDKKAVPAFAPPWDQPKFKIPGGGPQTPTGFPVFMGASAMIRKSSFGLYEAPKAILAAVYEGLQVPFDTALGIETGYFAKLVLGPQSRNMIRSLFVSKQALEKGAHRPHGVLDMPVKKLGVLGGGGFMGAGIAYVAAAAGIDVVVLDQTEEAAAKARAQAERILKPRVAKGRTSEAAAAAILARIHTTADYAMLAGADLCIEAVFEHPDVKKQVIAAAEQHLGSTAVFASNTSTLPIDSLAKFSKRPERFVGIHFFSPVEKMPLVEIIKGRQTGDEALAKALDFVRQLRKTPIVVNDARFFYANRLVLRFIEEAHHMLAEGVTPALIENAARMVGMPVGPLALNDETALDLGVKITHATRAALGDAYVPNPAEARIEDMVVKLGRLGRKAGKGFYDYPENGRKRLWPGLAELFPVAAEQPDIEELKSRFLTVQAVEAVRTLEDGVVTDVREIDVGAIFGWGFAPWTGGPISLIDTMGAAAFLAECRRLQAKYGERYAPPRLLVEIAASGATFYDRFAPQENEAAAA